MFFSAGHPAASIAGFIDDIFFYVTLQALECLRAVSFSWWGNDYLRLGSREGFRDISKAQCHSVATAWMNKGSRSVHENVLGYDPSHLQEHLKHEMAMSKTLSMV